MLLSGISGSRVARGKIWRGVSGKQGDRLPIALAQAKSTKSPIPKNVYASAIGLCKDFIIMQSRKPSNSDF